MWKPGLQAVKSLPLPDFWLIPFVNAVYNNLCYSVSSGNRYIWLWCRRSDRICINSHWVTVPWHFRVIGWRIGIWIRLNASCCLQPLCSTAVQTYDDGRTGWMAANRCICLVSSAMTSKKRWGNCKKWWMPVHLFGQERILLKEQDPPRRAALLLDGVKKLQTTFPNGGCMDAEVMAVDRGNAG